MGMEYFAFDMGQAFKPKKMFVGGLIIGVMGRRKRYVRNFSRLSCQLSPR